MATIRIEYDYAMSKAKQMETNADNVSKILNGLVDDMQANINDSTWSGAAADNFKAAWNRSAEDFSKFIEYMKSIQSKVETAAIETKQFDN